MEIKYFRLIKTIAEEGSIVNSSEKLFLTQSALSHQLIVLEERLGFKVFHRSRNKWKLTEEGEELYKLANEILQSIEKGFNKIKYIKEGATGTIRYSTECYSFYQGFPRFIQKMGILYPEIKLELVDATNQPVSKLISNEIDVLLTTSKPTSNSLMSLEICTDEVFAVMHKENKLANKPFLQATDFADVNLYIYSFPLETVSVYSYFLFPNKVYPKKIISIPRTEVILEMIEANMGLVCIPKWILDSYKISDNIVFKKIGVNGLIRTHYLAIRKEDRDKKYIDDFISSFEEDFSSK